MAAGTEISVTDTITIARDRSGKFLAKLVLAADQFKDYDSGYLFNFTEYPIADLDAIGRLLRDRLIFRTDCFVMHAVPIDPRRTRDVRRLLHDKPGARATLRDAPHWWLALDMDTVPRPDDIPATDLDACARLAIALLPSAFHGVRCIAQATAGHGLKPGCRLRLWFWLDRPLTCAELRQWLKGVPADRALFRPIQPIYTAKPEFMNGVADPIPVRIVELPGRATVPTPPAADLVPPPPPPRTSPAAWSNAPKGARAKAARAMIERAIDRAATAVDGERNNSLTSEAYTCGGLLHAAELTAEDIALRFINLGYDKSKDQDTIRRSIADGEARPFEPPLPRRDDRIVETYRTAHELLRMNVEAKDYIAALRLQNEKRSEPLPAAQLDQIALRCIDQAGGSDA